MTGSSAAFDRNVKRWLRYSQSPKGRLRHELTRYHLEQNIRSIQGKMRILDAGCGIGDMASLLAGRARQMVLLDFSENMLELARSRLSAKYPSPSEGQLVFLHGRVEELESLFPQGLFDLILCHSVLEYVEDPPGILSLLARRLAPCGVLSLVAANRFCEAFKSALVKNDLKGALLALHSRGATADLFDHAPKHTFSLQELEEMAGELNLSVVNRYGIRIFADYLPEDVMKEPGNEQLLFELEREASPLAPYFHVARYSHLICRNRE